MSSNFEVDVLEARRLMSVVPVTNLNDTGPGSLRYALDNAASGDTIDARNISGVIHNIIAPLSASRNLTVLGPGQSSLTIQGNGNTPVLLNQVGTLTLKDVTISGGENSGSGGGIYNRSNLILENVKVTNNHAYLYGGGIYSEDGNLTLINSTVTGNTAKGALEASGGALYMRGGKLTIDGSTIYNNVAEGAGSTLLAAGAGTGGGLYLFNTLASTITNTTLGQNTAKGGTSQAVGASGTASGGAIYINSATSTVFNSCTIAYNGAAGGGLSALTMALSQGGGIYSTGSGTVTMLNTIAAENTAIGGADILSSTLASLGNNLVGISTSGSVLSTLLGDKFGSALVPLAPGLSNVLTNNGGGTLTYALQSNSAAINTGTLDAPTLDQRGLGRRNAADIGAFEFNPNHLPTLANLTANGLSPTLKLNATAGVVVNAPISATDADSDSMTYTASGLPSWLKLSTVAGQPVLTGAPTEAAAGVHAFRLSAFDGFNTVGLNIEVTVAVPQIDLSTRGLLRVNGTDQGDTITIFARGTNVRVVRNDQIKNYDLSSVRAIQVFGFGGSDTISVSVANRGVYVDGGEGNDTIMGGNGYDILTGGMGNDSIFGNGGDDRLNGNAGNDYLNGGDGNDRIFGGKGIDKIIAGRGSNLLQGDEGNDYFDARNNNVDVIIGGAGKNVGVWDLLDSITQASLIR